MQKYLINLACLTVFYSCCWFCLWIISLHLVGDSEIASLLFPFGLRIGALLHTTRKYWPAIIGAELAAITWLAFLLGHIYWLPVLSACFLSLLVVWYFHGFYHGGQWQHLSVIGLVTITTATINAKCITIVQGNTSLVFLSSITGGLLLVPACYLLASYLRKDIWAPLTARVAKEPVSLKSSHLIFNLIIFILSILGQAALPKEFNQFAPFCLAIPIILLAYQYGWQGALLATLINSVSLLVVREANQLATTDLLLSLSAQTLTGILLGTGVQRQRELNTKLAQELTRNQDLSRHLIKTEEKVRTDIARELHDEIGQNITAIRIQASMLQRVDDVMASHKFAATIENLSLNIYDSTKGLLNRIRPKSIDDLGLEKAISQLIQELGFKQLGINVEVVFNIDASSLSDVVTITLYRICQEALNNIIKYARSSKVTLSLDTREVNRQTFHCLIISDNGTGFDSGKQHSGSGLQGIRERVEALGGKAVIGPSLHSDGITEPGTRLSVALPIEGQCSATGNDSHVL